MLVARRMVSILASNYYSGMTITREQSRMARGALEWSLWDLARAARISPTTVNQFERGHTATNNSTLAAIRRAFEDAGIIFIESDGEGPGVRLAAQREASVMPKKPR